MEKLYRFIALVLVLLGFIVGMDSGIMAQPPATGANKFLGNITTNYQVRDDFLQYWNQITGENEHKWSSVEGTRGQMNWAAGDRIVEFARNNDIPWRFHTLIWGSQYPGWMDNLSQQEQLAAVTNWMDEAAARYPDVEMIDVVNEALPTHAPPNTWKRALGGDGTTGWDWIITAFEMARERWPNAILKYNDYNIVEWEYAISGVIDMLNILIENGAPIDALGIQSHDVYRLSAQQLQTNIDRLAAVGLPIFVTEYDIPSNNDQEQLDIMSSQFPVMWNHPKVVGVTYWGYIVGSTWVDGTGLKHGNGTERPALTWLMDYVRENPDPPNDYPDLVELGGGGGIIVPPEAVTIPGRVEGEGFATMSGIQAEDNTAGDGRHIGHINSGDWARYLIDVSAAGEYSLRVRVGTEADANNTITFKNESGATVATVTVDASQTSGWQDWYIETSSINLEAGEQELLVEFSGSTEYLYNIDWFEIVPLPANIPGRVQAESYSAMSGIQVEPDPQGNLNVGWINPGDWTRYLLDVSETGTYSMRFRVATGIDANNDIIVKNQQGTTLGTLTVDASQTDGWHDWYVDSILVDLNLGQQEITLEFDGSTEYLYNIDWFEIYSVTTSAVVMREFESAGYRVWSAPNPFVKEVEILTSAPSSTEILKVEIYNIRGEKVDEVRVKGNNQATLQNSSKLKSGIYYMVLSNKSGKVAVKSMLKI